MSTALVQGLVNPDDENDMLRNMFWSGMKTNLKDISGHLYYKCPEFNELRRALRIWEQDREKMKFDSDNHTNPIQAKWANVEEKWGETDDLFTIMNMLSTELEELKRDREMISIEVEHWQEVITIHILKLRTDIKVEDLIDFKLLKHRTIPDLRIVNQHQESYFGHAAKNVIS